jgi:hypothetical protein
MLADPALVPVTQFDSDFREAAAARWNPQRTTFAFPRSNSVLRKQRPPVIRRSGFERPQSSSQFVGAGAGLGNRIDRVLDPPEVTKLPSEFAGLGRRDGFPCYEASAFRFGPVPKCHRGIVGLDIRPARPLFVLNPRSGAKSVSSVA